MLVTAEEAVAHLVVLKRPHDLCTAALGDDLSALVLARHPPPCHSPPMPPRRLDIAQVHHGRGAVSNPAGRFDTVRSEAEDDGWGSAAQPQAAVATVVRDEHAKSIITYNDSPDLGFDRSINPYRGCEHGCIYCYARPSHGYLGLSSGLDFETQLFAKVNAVELLRQELAKPGYLPALVLIGANTDAYQPIERDRQLTRGVLEVLVQARHPFSVITKSALVERDVALLAEAARLQLCHAYISVTTLDVDIARKMEPRAAPPQRRLQAMAALVQAGIPTGVMVAPIIPGLTDHETESILQAAAGAGAQCASYVLLRMPHEIKDLYAQWLEEHFAGKAQRARTLLRDMRDGRDNDPQFGSRMRGTGVYAELLRKRFALATRRFGLDQPWPPVDATGFRRPALGRQLPLL